MDDVYSDIGFAKLDLSREQRTGQPETIYCAGKTNEQLLKILQTFQEKEIAVLGTRCSVEQYEYVKNSNLPLQYYSNAKILTLNAAPKIKLPGKLAICAA